MKLFGVCICWNLLNRNKKNLFSSDSDTKCTKVIQRTNRHPKIGAPRSYKQPSEKKTVSNTRVREKTTRNKQTVWTTKRNEQTTECGMTSSATPTKKKKTSAQKEKRNHNNEEMEQKPSKLKNVILTNPYLNFVAFFFFSCFSCSTVPRFVSLYFELCSSERKFFRLTFLWLSVCPGHFCRSRSPRSLCMFM